MKKKVLFVFLIMIVCLVAVGCKKKEKEIVVGGWTIDLSTESLSIPEDALDTFNKALTNKKDKKLKPITLLATQTVAGTNYMFFCSDSSDDSTYKVVIVYKDLSGNSSITRISDFDITKYAGKDSDGATELLSGGWAINTLQEDAKIREEIMSTFTEATNMVDDVTYKPVIVLAKQVVSGTNYAILVLRESGETITFNVLTIYNDLENHAKIINSSYVDLASFNK